MASVTIDLTQTSGGKLAYLTSKGLIQGNVQASPFLNGQLETGYVDTAATYPLIVGRPIQIAIAVDEKGALIKESTAMTNVKGIAVSQAAGVSGVQTASSPAPIYLQGGAVNFYPNGSKARIVVPINSTFAATLAAGDTIDTEITWDFTNHEIITVGVATALPWKIVEMYSDSVDFGISFDTATGKATYNKAAKMAVVEI